MDVDTWMYASPYSLTSMFSPLPSLLGSLSLIIISLADSDLFTLIIALFPPFSYTHSLGLVSFAVGITVACHALSIGGMLVS